MIVMDEKYRHLEFLKWLSIALCLKLVLLNIVPFAFYIQQFLFYSALFKSLSYFKGKTLAKNLIFIDIGLLFVNLLPINIVLSTWQLVITMIVELFIILEFGKIVAEIERQYKALQTTSRILTMYQWLVLGVAAGWTFIMNVDYFSMIIFVSIGAILLFIANVRLLFHLQRIRKSIKFTMKSRIPLK